MYSQARIGLLLNRGYRRCYAFARPCQDPLAGRLAGERGWPL